MKKIQPGRVRILYLLLLILISISVVPLWIYGTRMLESNRERLTTEQQTLQVIASKALAQAIAFYHENARSRLTEVFSSVATLASEIPSSKYDTDPRLREVLQKFVTEQPSVLFATVVNDEARGAQAGTGYNAAGDAFVRKSLDAAFMTARQGSPYESNPITVVREGRNEPVMVMARPIVVNNRFGGMVAAVVTLEPIVQRLVEMREPTYKLEAYIVDSSGRLVASNNDDQNVSGLDMSDIAIVQNFLASRGQASGTSTFEVRRAGKTIAMLGTYSPIPNVGWGVVVQKPLSDALYDVYQMRYQTIGLGFVLVLVSLVVGFVSAKTITRPMERLTQAARSIAQRDYSQRASVESVIEEVAQLGEGLNQATQEIQRYIGELEGASQANRELFIQSIEMIAAAVDAKDPYTKGHSGRVAQYSVMLARELGLPDDEVDRVRISATLHDVGKIGVEDRVLKKPGVLTNEEFEIMKRHTVMGYEIVRQVKQLESMLPGIRWHHESLNGKGYPDGIQGDEIPLIVRIISVADTFDAITTDRPYQAGRDFPAALEILRKHAGSKYDPIVVDALHACHSKGDLKKAEQRRTAVISVPQPAAS